MLRIFFVQRSKKVKLGNKAVDIFEFFVDTSDTTRSQFTNSHLFFDFFYNLKKS